MSRESDGQLRQFITEIKESVYSRKGNVSSDERNGFLLCAILEEICCVSRHLSTNSLKLGSVRVVAAGFAAGIGTGIGVWQAITRLVS